MEWYTLHVLGLNPWVVRSGSYCVWSLKPLLAWSGTTYFLLCTDFLVKALSLHIVY